MPIPMLWSALLNKRRNRVPASPSTMKAKTPTRKTKAKKIPSALTLTLPGTSANLGPAFDAAALAFDLNFQITAKPAKEFSIRASGRDTAICGQLEDNLI